MANFPVQDTDLLSRTRDSRVQNAMADLISNMDDNIAELIQMYKSEGRQIGVPDNFDDLADKLALAAFDYVRGEVRQRTGPRQMRRR